MKITKTAIHRGVTVGMIYLIAVGFGIFSFIRLKLDLYPNLTFPLVAIVAQYQGVGPEDMETVVTRPMEEAVASVKNVSKLTSTSSQGISVILVEFNWGTDMDQAKIDVRENLDFLNDVLPPDLTDPLIFAFDPSMQPIMYLAVQSDVYGPDELRRISEKEIEPRIERIPGVAAAFTGGGMRREIKVLADPARLHATNVSIHQIVTALQSNNLQIPSGQIDDPHLEFSLRTSGEYTSLEEIENTPIDVRGTRVLRIKDVADVKDDFADEMSQVWSNGEPAVMLVVQKQSDANTVQVCNDVFDQIETIESQIPRGVRLVKFYDAAMFIEKSISNLGNNAWQAIVLTFLVLVCFLRNVRSSLIVAVSIPFSVIVTFAVMDQWGLTLNIVSMAGLALSVGMLVDTSIVVVESIFRHHQEGEGVADASYNGATEVAMAVTASTLTTLSVFVPVLFVPGIAGQLFREMVITICFSLSVSLVVALTLVPLMTSRFLALGDTSKIGSSIRNLSAWVGKGIEGLHSVYDGALRWSLRRRKSVVAAAFTMFIASIVSLSLLGGEFMPESDMGFMSMTVDRTPGTSLEAMEKSTRELTEIIKRLVPEAEFVYANFGQGEGIMALFSSQSSSEGDMAIRLTDRKNRERSMFEVQDALREECNSLPDVKMKFEDRGAAVLMGTGGDIVVQIFGHDMGTAESVANDVIRQTDGIEGIVSIESSVKASRPELLITPDRRRIADLGLSTAIIGRTISTCMLGSIATRYREGGDEYDIRVQLPEASRATKEDLENIMIMTPLGREVPLRSVADITYSTAPRKIVREDQQRMVTVTVDVSGRDLQGVTSDVRDALRRVQVPSDFRLDISGVAEEQQESFMYLFIALLVAVLLTYMVMAAQFESFMDPFVILFTIPLSMIGVALGLILTGTDLTVMALVGMVMLVGVIVNNGIVLIDYVNQLRARGMEMFDAIVKAGSVRLRPVLMTALTTIFGMLPLALGLGESGENWAPMARALIGGLTVGTMLTLIVVPIIYIMMEHLGERVKLLRKRKKA